MAIYYAELRQIRVGDVITPGSDGSLRWTTDELESEDVLQLPLINRTGSNEPLFVLSHEHKFGDAGKKGGQMQVMDDLPTYKGYAGRQVTLKVALHDAFADQPMRTDRVIAELRLWSRPFRGKVHAERQVQELRITPAIARSPTVLPYVKAQAEKGTLPIGKSILPQNRYVVSEEVTPTFSKKLLPLPLAFRFGSLEIPACVIKSLDIRIQHILVVENGYLSVTSAEVDLTIQEILISSLWNIESPTKQIIIGETDPNYRYPDLRVVTTSDVSLLPLPPAMAPYPYQPRPIGR
jgi:hypothetical protein